jgi:hypothetical protein
MDIILDVADYLAINEGLRVAGIPSRPHIISIYLFFSS